jgi:hypothetical protein
MDLTHAQAREMIQFDADSALSADSLRVLKSHLASCNACRRYAESIHAMEIHMRRAMGKRWNLRPAPLAMDAIRNSKSPQHNLVATRFAVITSAILMIVVVTLGIANAAKIDGNPQARLSVPLIPTPSLRTTNTSPVCEQIRYQVQPDDTLESIADQFSIPVNDLLDANHIRTGTVTSGTELIIPLCSATPIGTVHPPTFTTTITPLFETLSHTPDG